MNQIPTNISAHSDCGVLEIDWPDRQDSLPYHFLRSHCQCAHCVNEWTGERILDPNSVPADIRIEKMEPVGGYAIRIRWSDGHSSGLYTWERLRELGTRGPGD